MTRKPKRTKTEVRDAIKNSRGHIGVIAHRLGVARQTVYDYLRRYPEVDDLLQAERRSGRDEIVELAQNKLLHRLMEEDDPRMIMFALRHYDNDAGNADNLNVRVTGDVNHQFEGAHDTLARILAGRAERRGTETGDTEADG